jgi:hypothetical protein
MMRRAASAWFVAVALAAALWSAARPEQVDSWHTGTGATDNGAGGAVMMQASAIIASLVYHAANLPDRLPAGTQ